jgi:ferredoxin-NADP reductase
MSDMAIDQQVDKILFILYVRLVDHEDGIGLRDIERFDRLMENPSLLEVKPLEPAIKVLSQSYSELWKAYQAGVIGQSNEEISRALAQVPAEYWRRHWLEWRDAFVQFVQYFANEPTFVARFDALRGKRKKRLDQAGLLTVLLMNWSFGNLVGEQSVSLNPEISKDAVDLAQSAIATMLLEAATKEEKISLARQGSHRLVCVDVREEAKDVKTFTFVTESQQLWVYQPGQFMTFEIPFGDSWLRRSYSISSSPTQPYSLDITIKRIHDGKGSNWFHDNMKPGVTISARGPHGQFTVLNSSARKILMLAAGVGITPLHSMLKWLTQSRSPCDVVLVNRVHSLEDLVFAGELAALKRQSHGRIQVITVSTKKEGEWSKSLGLRTDDEKLLHIQAQGLQELVPDILERAVYLCGPDRFADACATALEQLGFNMDNYYYESFGGVGAETGSLGHISQAEESQTSTIEFRKSGKTVKCAPGDYILDVAQYHGIAIDSSCRMGSCGSCKCTKLEGEVLMDNECGLSVADIVSQQILTCVAKVPAGAVVIDA